MRPVRKTDAHETDRLAEMVCSNSFRSDNPANAVGLLKREMESVGSLVLEEARKAAVPAGDALAVDRTVFAEAVTRRIAKEPLRTRSSGREARRSADPGGGFLVVATGPLTSAALERRPEAPRGEVPLLLRRGGADRRGFLARPVEALRGAPLGQGRRRRLPERPALTKAEYEAFVGEPSSRREGRLPRLREGRLLRGLPADRGDGGAGRRDAPARADEAVRPRGPEDGKEPYAAVQLRQDDLARTHFNLVGFQTKLKVGDQRRIFRTLPGLENAEFVRYGMLHRNTYIKGPGAPRPALPVAEGPARLLRGAADGRRGVPRVGRDRPHGRGHARAAPRREGARAGPVHDGARLARPARLDGARRGVPADERDVRPDGGRRGPDVRDKREAAGGDRRACALSSPRWTRSRAPRAGRHGPGRL